MVGALRAPTINSGEPGDFYEKNTALLILGMKTGRDDWEQSSQSSCFSAMPKIPVEQGLQFMY
jgi:hypothetical protein